MEVMLLPDTNSILKHLFWDIENKQIYSDVPLSQVNETPGLFTPTWAGSSSNPSIGNGTLEAKYIQLGNMVVVFYNIVMGSTTTFGSGFWTLSVPITAPATGRGLPGIGFFRCTDETSGSTEHIASAYLIDADNIVFDTQTGSRANVRNTAPFTWANTDSFAGFFVYFI